MKKGLILEGGAMRGMYTAGVLDIFMENDITVDGAIGVSAGAAFGCNLKSKQIGRTIRYNTKYCRDPRYVGLRSLIKTGDIYGADFCYNQIPNRLDIFDVETYQKNPMDFYVVTTDVETGKPIYHLCPNGDATDIKWFRASASMPMVSNIVEIDGFKMLDGGISDSIPIHKFMEMGYEKNIVITFLANFFHSNFHIFAQCKCLFYIFFDCILIKLKHFYPPFIYILLFTFQ